MSDFFLKVGNRVPSITGTLTINGTPIGNLTGATVRFRMRALVSTPGVYKVNAVATIVDPVTCAVRYDWAALDVDTAGIWIAEWHVTYADGKEQTVPNASTEVVYISENL